MIITLEISYYPLSENFNDLISLFIEKLSSELVKVEVGLMSTVVIGEYDEVMKLLTTTMKELMDQYPSVFSIKIANACFV